jgi:hypothetical protein
MGMDIASIDIKLIDKAKPVAKLVRKAKGLMGR